MKRKTSQGDIHALKVQLARALADYDNLRKRSEREREQVIRYANQSLIEKLLTVVALLEKVEKNTQDKGLEVATAQLKDLINYAGVILVAPSPGERFDENKHEVVEVITPLDNAQSGTIAEVVDKGAAWVDGALILPARVKVYGEVSEKKEELQKETMRGDYV